MFRNGQKNQEPSSDNSCGLRCDASEETRTIWLLTTLASATLIIACIVLASSKRTFATCTDAVRQSSTGHVARACEHMYISTRGVFVCVCVEAGGVPDHHNTVWL